MKKNKILLFCMIFVATGVFSQPNHPKGPTGKDFIKTYFYLPPAMQVNNVKKNVVPANFYFTNLGFFCKQELKIQATTRLPLKLRLGSVPYCDWMEGKKNAGILPAY
jgi:hypothetical protein